MKKVLITLEDDQAKVLDKYPNKSYIVREALNVYLGDISTDTLQGMRATYKLIAQKLSEIDSKVDYLSGVPIKMAYDPVKKEVLDKPVKDILVTTPVSVNKRPSLVNFPTMPQRNYRDIPIEINKLERERDEKLEWCQDPEEYKTITQGYKLEIDALWEEYHELKGTE